MSAPNLAFWTVSPGCGELRPAPLRPPGEGEVLVRSLYSAVSRGTESLVFRGEVPESEYQRMRAPFQEGDFPGPVKYGYIGVGVVEDGVGAAAAALRGRTVFCLHPHQQRYVVPAERRRSRCPRACPPARAVLAANLETAINACWDGAPARGRPRRGGRRRRGRQPGRLAVRAHPRGRGRADRHRPGPRAPRGRARPGPPPAGPGAWRLRPRLPRQRPSRRPRAPRSSSPARKRP